MRLNQPLFWLLTLIWFVLGAWWYSGSSCSTCNTTAIVPVMPDSPAVTAPAVLTPPLLATDSSWRIENLDNLRFAKSGDVPVLSSSVTQSIDSLAMHCTSATPAKTVTVTGYYGASEKNTTSFSNLGLARAEALKKILMAKGVVEKNIITNAVVSNDLYFTASDTLIGGAAFQFGAVAAPVALFEPHTVYFNTGKNTLNVTPELASYLEAANKYLQANPDKKLTVTGYTDNVGDAQKNIELSAARAVFVKAELGKRGISEAQIQTDGKGMADPVADNATAEGRAKNRRVSITL
jgi:OmpA-OmpF porin, OOP family